MPADASIADRIDAVAAADGFSGVVRVTGPGVGDITRAYGVADRATGRPMTGGTRLAIASGTKTFTALAVLRLVDAGVLTLDAPVRTWLGADLPDIDAAVTVQHLLAHRSGIGDYFDESAIDHEEFALPLPAADLVDPDDWLPVLTGHPMVAGPGTEFAYNNGGFVVLALVAERASGRRYRELVAEIGDLAGMTDTGFHVNDESGPEFAIGYLDDGRTNVGVMPRFGCGDGGLSSTVTDVERLWTALDAGRIVAPRTVALMTAAHSDDPDSGRRYGLGVWLPPTGPDVIMEGCDAGISFRSAHDPTTGRTWTVIANTTDGAWPVARALADAFRSE